jgi:hypothetical protein
MSGLAAVEILPTSPMWPYLPALERLVLALALGLFVGLEREWRRKEAGLRTFGFAGMIGCLGGLLGTSFLIASIGFANYILLKLYGARGIELTGFLGGLVNSTVTVAELAGRVRETPELAGVAYRGVMIATAAMVVRNGILLAILAPRALVAAAPALILMLGACLILAFAHGRPTDSNPAKSLALPLKSPFSLQSTFKFGLIFLALQVVGTLAQRALGQFGFYAISIAGGLISSAVRSRRPGHWPRRGRCSLAWREPRQCWHRSQVRWSVCLSWPALHAIASFPSNSGGASGWSSPWECWAPSSRTSSGTPDVTATILIGSCRAGVSRVK